MRNAVRSVQPPRYVRAGTGSIVDAVEPRIRELLKEFPQMPATVIAERIGWDRSLTVLKERVRLLRPVYAPADPASRTTYEPGEVGQCDLWFPPAQIPLGFGQVGSADRAAGAGAHGRVLAVPGGDDDPDPHRARIWCWASGR